MWLSKNETDDCFWRSAISGGRATVRARKGKRTEGHYGDIIGTNKLGRMFIKKVTAELKCGYPNDACVTIHDCVTASSATDKRTLLQWIRQAKRAAELAGTPDWILVHKPDRREAILYCNGSLFSDLDIGELQYSGTFQTKKGNLAKDTVGFCSLRRFIKEVDPDTLLNLIKD